MAAITTPVDGPDSERCGIREPLRPSFLGRVVDEARPCVRAVPADGLQRLDGSADVRSGALTGQGPEVTPDEPSDDHREATRSRPATAPVEVAAGNEAGPEPAERGREP